MLARHRSRDLLGHLTPLVRVDDTHVVTALRVREPSHVLGEDRDAGLRFHCDVRSTRAMPSEGHDACTPWCTSGRPLFRPLRRELPSDVLQERLSTPALTHECVASLK